RRAPDRHRPRARHAQRGGLGVRRRRCVRRPARRPLPHRPGGRSRRPLRRLRAPALDEVTMDPELARYLDRREQLLARVRRLLIEQLRLRRDPDEIDPDTFLFGAGLGLDSVDAVELVVALEVEFGISLPDVEAARLPLRTINTLID